MDKKQERASLITVLCLLLLLVVLRFAHILPKSNIGYHHVETRQEMRERFVPEK